MALPCLCRYLFAISKQAEIITILKNLQSKIIAQHWFWWKYLKNWVYFNISCSKSYLLCFELNSAWKIFSFDVSYNRAFGGKGLNCPHPFTEHRAKLVNNRQISSKICSPHFGVLPPTPNFSVALLYWCRSNHEIAKT